MYPEEFYVQYGKAVYALAMADGDVQGEEREQLMQSIRKELLPLEDKKDEFGSNLAYYILFAFEQLEEQAGGAQQCCNDFIQFIKERRLQVPPETQALLNQVMYRIADAYGGIDPGEQQVLEQFKTKLAQTQQV